MTLHDTSAAARHKRPHRRPSLTPLVLALLLAAQPPVHAQATDGDTPMPAARGRAPVTLNFVNAEIEAVSRAIGTMLDRQIVVDPRVKGQITVTSEKAMPPQEAWRSYLAALRGMGFTVVENAGLLKVVPEAEAKLQAGTVSIGAPTARGDQILTQIFRLNHENPNNLVAVLRPLISANNTINANAANGTLIITDYADNLQRLAKIIAALDQPAASEVEVIAIKNALAADLAPLVQRLAEGGSGVVVPGAPASQGSATSIVVEPRSNSLVVRTANPARLNAVKSLIAKLDQPTQGGGPAGNIWVVYLKNADAVKMAEVLRAAMASGAAASSGSGAGAGAGFSGSGSRPSTGIAGTGVGLNTSGSSSASSSGASSQSTTPVSASASPSTGGQIQADPSTNSLIISAPEAVYRQMRQVIDQLDSRRAQIYIESMIVEVTGDNSADFGFQWQGLIGQSGDKYGLVGGTNFGSTGNLLTITGAGASADLTGLGTALGQGLNIGLIKNFGNAYGLAAIARLLQSQTNTNIVSTPNLITLDNEEAKIVVGQNVPFITGQFTGTGTGTTSPFQTIERKDVGITLRIKPQVGEGGTVRMVIFQESSSVADRLAAGTASSGPTTNKRSIESTVTVDDGAILVLGGLIEDRYTENKSKVPLLGDIPYVGALFRSETRTKQRTNLMVFLRPVVMRDAATATKLTLDRYDLIRASQKDAQPQQNIVLPVDGSPVLPEYKPYEAPSTTTVPVLAPPDIPEKK
ncbi:MAG TPA: type II secretion system secretin GspD [Ideonella sp.]|nr:type II secretion system secretin GspD [Ideonella sp.]